MARFVLVVVCCALALAGCQWVAAYSSSDPRVGGDGALDASDASTDADGGLADAGRHRDADGGTRVVVVAPYPKLANWNEYVAVTDSTRSPYEQPGVACDVKAAARATDCAHVGQMRQVVLPQVLDCDNLEYGDMRQAFRWSCRVVGATTIFRTISLRLGLGGLIEGMAFAPNQFYVNRGGVDIVRSAKQSWGWTNPVLPLPAGHATTITKLDVPGAVYVVPASGGVVATRGLNIAADGVSLLVEQGATLTNNGAIGDNCVTKTGAIGTAPSGIDTRRTVVCGGSQARIWVEGRVVGDQSNVRTGVLLADMRMSRLQRLDVSDTFDVGVALRGGTANRVQALRVWRVGSDNPFSQKKVGFYVDGETGLRVRAVVVGDALGDGILVESSNDVALSFVSSSNNGRNALHFLFGKDLRAVGVLATSSRHGVHVHHSDDATLAHVTAVRNAIDGVRLESAKEATVIGLASLDNGNDGLDLRNSVGTRLFDVLLAHHINAVASGGLYCEGCKDNEIQGTLWVGNNRRDCTFSNATSAGYSQNTCTQSGSDQSNDWGSGNSNGLLRTNVDCASCITGRLTTEPGCKSYMTGGNGAASYTALAPDFLCATGHYSTWGRVGQGFGVNAARGRCEGSTGCSLWSYSATGTPLRFVRGTPSDGADCPPATRVLVTDRRGVTMLVGAIEVTADGIGNDDGLCEQGEVCSVAPHLGADQRMPAGGSCRGGLLDPRWPRSLRFLLAP